MDKKLCMQDTCTLMKIWKEMEERLDERKKYIQQQGFFLSTRNSTRHNELSYSLAPNDHVQLGRNNCIF